MSRLSWFQLGYRKGPPSPKTLWTALAWMIALAMLALGWSRLAHAQSPKELQVMAASDLQPVMPLLADAYLKATGVKLTVSFGSSAALAQQILNGAPVDLFMSADFVNPEKIVAAGLADAKAPTQYAKGTLVLWARKDSPLQPISIDSLTDKRVSRVAIANPLHAPYGIAAETALKRMHMYDAVSPHLVVAENIAQAAQFVESGNAQLGLISLTLASSQHFRDVGTYLSIPPIYTPILQCAVVLAKSDRRAEAHAFLNWLLTSEVQTTLPKMGLGPVK